MENGFLEIRAVFISEQLNPRALVFISGQGHAGLYAFSRPVELLVCRQWQIWRVNLPQAQSQVYRINKRRAE